MTGVQTCALPICAFGPALRRASCVSSVRLGRSDILPCAVSVVPLRCSLLCSVPGVAVKLRQSRAPQRRESPSLFGLRLSAGGSDNFPVGSSLCNPRLSSLTAARSLARRRSSGSVSPCARPSALPAPSAPPPLLTLSAARSESLEAVRRLPQRAGVRMRGRGLSIGVPLSGRLKGAFRRASVRCIPAFRPPYARLEPRAPSFLRSHVGVVRVPRRSEPHASPAVPNLTVRASWLGCWRRVVACAQVRASSRPPATYASIALGSSLARIRLPG